MKGSLKPHNKLVGKTNVSKNNSIQSFFLKTKTAINEVAAEPVEIVTNELSSDDVIELNPGVSINVGNQFIASSELEATAQTDSGSTNVSATHKTATTLNACSLQTLKTHPLFLGKTTTKADSKAKLEDITLIENQNQQTLKTKIGKSGRSSSQPSPRAPAEHIPSPEPRSGKISPEKVGITGPVKPIDPIRSNEKLGIGAMRKSGMKLAKSRDATLSEETPTLPCHQQPGGGDHEVSIAETDIGASSGTPDSAVTQSFSDQRLITEASGAGPPPGEVSGRPRRQAVLNTLARQEQLKLGIYEPDEDDFVQGNVFSQCLANMFLSHILFHLASMTLQWV